MRTLRTGRCLLATLDWLDCFQSADVACGEFMDTGAEEKEVLVRHGYGLVVGGWASHEVAVVFVVGCYVRGKGDGVGL
jgi:hypothetical protein